MRKMHNKLIETSFAFPSYFLYKGVMKLFITLFILLTHSAFAAEFSRVEEMSNTKIESLRREFLGLARGSVEYKGVAIARVLEIREDTETIEDVLEQIITERNYYDVVEVNKIKKGNEAMAFSEITDKLISDRGGLKERISSRFDVVMPTRQVVYFEVNTTNAQTSCQHLAIYDIKTQEILFLGACEN